MKRFPGARAVVGLAIAALPGCQFVDDLISGNNGPADVDDLVASVERVSGELDASKTAMLAAIQSLQKVTAPDFQGDAVKAHKELVNAIEDSEDQTDDLRKSLERMQAEADPVFEQWTKDLEAYSNPEMRQRSQARLSAARERYDAVVAAVTPVLVECEAINQTLGDHALFLKHDMNPAALATIQDDVKKVAKEASELDPAFNSGKAAARAYVDAASQPKAPPKASETEQAVAVKGS
jgi:hypothetical protein